MNQSKTIRAVYVVFMWLICTGTLWAQSLAVLSGKVISSDQGIVDFASV